MRVFNVVFCEADKKDSVGAYVGVYSYASLNKAVEGATKLVKETFLDNNEELFDGKEVITLDKFRQIMSMYRWYGNESNEEHMTETFWIRIDENIVEGMFKVNT